jgi:hypothetical protein
MVRSPARPRVVLPAQRHCRASWTGIRPDHAGGVCRSSNSFTMAGLRFAPFLDVRQLVLGHHISKRPCDQRAAAPRSPSPAPRPCPSAAFRTRVTLLDFLDRTWKMAEATPRRFCSGVLNTSSRHCSPAARHPRGPQWRRSPRQVPLARRGDEGRADKLGQRVGTLPYITVRRPACGPLPVRGRSPASQELRGRFGPAPPPASAGAGGAVDCSNPRTRPSSSHWAAPSRSTF